MKKTIDILLNIQVDNFDMCIRCESLKSDK